MQGEPRPGIPAATLDRLIEQRARFLTFLTSRVGSEDVAEDILQSAFVIAIEKGGQVRDDESSVAWFYRVLRNAVIDYYRQRASSDRALESFAREMEHHESETAVRDKVCRCVSGIAETLKPEYRQALLTIDVGEGRLADLAAQAGISVDNAAARISRARRALRVQVTATCGICADHGCLNCTCRH